MERHSSRASRFVGGGYHCPAPRAGAGTLRDASAPAAVEAGYVTNKDGSITVNLRIPLAGGADPAKIEARGSDRRCPSRCAVLRLC
jgi:hypothetical protein